MKIDISRLNLLEKDIEDWLYANPGSIRTNWGSVTEWVGRQYRLPSGIADLVGVLDGGIVVIVEVKNVPINKAALTQVCRYAADLLEILQWRNYYPNPEMQGMSYVEKIVVGPSIDDQTFTEAAALNVSIHEFSASLDIDISEIEWTAGTRDSMSATYRQMAHAPEWDRFGKHTDILQAEYLEGNEQEEAPTPKWFDEPSDSTDAEHF